MSNHKKALVPIEVWAYQSPDLTAFGKSIDVGLMTEALIYYDEILLNVTNQLHFAELLKWFIYQKKLDVFLGLVQDGIIQLYDYSFMITAVEKDGVFSIHNLQDQIQLKQNTFEQRFLYHPEVEKLLPQGRKRKAFYKTFRGKVIEAKADDFGEAVTNAKSDFDNEARASLIMQAYLDELYHLNNLGNPPIVDASISLSEDKNEKTIDWNIDLNNLAEISGRRMKFHQGLPLTASAISNRYLLSASRLGSDLYLPSPISVLVGDKLYESAQQLSKTQEVIDELITEVEYPDIRSLTNRGQIGIKEILDFRKKGKKFRNWLQEEGDRDRNALIAYHHEVAKESSIKSYSRKTLRMFGILGGGALGGGVPAIFPEIDPVLSTSVGGAAGAGMSYILELVSRINEDWKPVVFGNWMKGRIEKHLKD